MWSLPLLLLVAGCRPKDERAPAGPSEEPQSQAQTQPAPAAEEPVFGVVRYQVPLPELGSVPEGWQRKSVQEKLQTVRELQLDDFTAAYHTLAHALADGDPSVREAALERAPELPLALQMPLLAQSLQDPVPDLRYQALDQLKKVEGPEALPVLRQAITSPLQDVKILAANQLTFRGDKPSLEILFEGLRDPDPKIRQEVQENLDFLLSIKFRSYHHANQWWAENRAQYDEELFHKED